jgi:C4-type Zn-finger protein
VTDPVSSRGAFAKIKKEEGGLGFAFVLRGSFGNSTIISESTTKRRIGREELKEVKFGDQGITTRNVQ